MTLTVEPNGPAHPDPAEPVEGFDLRTVSCDATRARLEVAGRLDAGAAVLLAEVLNGHLRIGRRYLRVHVAALRSITAEAVAVIAEAHQRVLGLGGTMILTGVAGPIEDRLRGAAPAGPLFLVAPTAAESIAAPDGEMR